MATAFYTKCKNGKYRLRLDTDNKDHYQYVRGAARRCAERKTITEGDLMRSKSDEEMAEFFATIEVHNWHIRMIGAGYEPTQNQRQVAKQGFYEKWLRSLKRKVEN